MPARTHARHRTPLRAPATTTRSTNVQRRADLKAHTRACICTPSDHDCALQPANGSWLFTNAKLAHSDSAHARTGKGTPESKNAL